MHMCVCVRGRRNKPGGFSHSFPLLASAHPRAADDRLLPSSALKKRTTFFFSYWTYSAWSADTTYLQTVHTSFIHFAARLQQRQALLLRSSKITTKLLVVLKRKLPSVGDNPIISMIDSGVANIFGSKLASFSPLNGLV